MAVMPTFGVDLVVALQVVWWVALGLKRRRITKGAVELHEPRRRDWIDQVDRLVTSKSRWGAIRAADNAETAGSCADQVEAEARAAQAHLKFHRLQRVDEPGVRWNEPNDSAAHEGSDPQ